MMIAIVRVATGSRRHFFSKAARKQSDLCRYPFRMS